MLQLLKIQPVLLTNIKTTANPKYIMGEKGKSFAILTLASLLFLQCSYKEHSDLKKPINCETKRIESVIDTLVYGEWLNNDTINYLNYLQKDRNTFIECLIGRVDIDIVKNTDPVYINPKLSTIPKVKQYAGVRAVCFLNNIINDIPPVLAVNNDFFLRYCPNGFLLKSGSVPTLDDLKQFKKVYEAWYSETKDLSVEKQKTIWNEKYFQKITEKIM